MIMRYTMKTGGIFVIRSSRNSVDTTKVETEICSTDLDCPRKEKEVKRAPMD